MGQFNTGTFNPYTEQDVEPAKTSLLAISGFVSSVIFCCPLTSLIGLLLGVGGLVSISSSNGRRKGTGLASAAIIIAILSMVGQVVVGRMLWPFVRGGIQAVKFSFLGPTEFIHDLEMGDLPSARVWLYPAFNAQISDGQLRYFAGQVSGRYGQVQMWQQTAQPPFKPSPNSEQTFNLDSQLHFSNGSYSTTMKLTVSYGSAGELKESGIAGIVIHDPDLGDLTLDSSTPSSEQAPPAPPGEPGETGAKPENDGGG